MSNNFLHGKTDLDSIWNPAVDDEILSEHNFLLSSPYQAIKNSKTSAIENVHENPPNVLHQHRASIHSEEKIMSEPIMEEMKEHVNIASPEMDNSSSLDSMRSILPELKNITSQAVIESCNSEDNEM